MKKKIIISIFIAIIILTIGAFLIFRNKGEKPEEILTNYFACIERQSYEEMYNMTNKPESISKEDYLARNKNIYEGIEAKDIYIEIKSVEKNKDGVKVTYNTKMNTLAGNIEFDNTAKFIKDKNREYKIDWSSNLIFPELNNDYKIRVSRGRGKRGKLLDRNGKTLAETTDALDRFYPYKEASSHITGYIQGITKEELEARKEEGYNAKSLIGKTGLEKEFEQRLRGKEGIEIYIENSQGQNLKTLVKTEGQDGEDVKLTIDIDIQSKLYEKLKNDEGFFVVMNPKTGEVLALVSTPSYDANKFIEGMTNEEWESYSNSEAKPLYTRFLESWCPGSTFKAVTGAVGLTSGKLPVDDEFNYTGLAWQKSSSWKDHKITTLTAYNGKKNLKNAIVYSDNIYFAQAVLKIGEKTFIEGLKKIKFNENIDFEMPTSKSRYSNSEGISSESILADSGYGQGQILVNPIHMASIYSAFLNDGNMIKPYLEYKENKAPEYLVENAFSKESSNIIKEYLIEAVENPNGTGHDVKVEGVTIAGKTGTAELKTSKDEKGDTLGWFNCFTADENIENPLLIVSMAKNKKSTYLKQIIRTLFE